MKSKLLKIVLLLFHMIFFIHQRDGWPQDTGRMAQGFFEGSTKIKNPFLPKLPQKPKPPPEKKKVEEKKVPEKKPPPPVAAPPPAEEKKPKKKEEPVVIHPPPLKIEGLIWNTDQPQAIINDQIFNIGQEAFGAEIIDIRPNEIDIHFKGKKFTISVTKGVL